MEGHCPHTGVGVCCQKMVSNPSEQGWVFIGKLKNSPLASEVSHNSQDLVNPDKLHLRNCVCGGGDFGHPLTNPEPKGSRKVTGVTHLCHCFFHGVRMPSGGRWILFPRFRSSGICWHELCRANRASWGALRRLWVPEGHTEGTSSSSELSRGVQGAEPAPGSDISKQDRLGMLQQPLFPPQQMSAPLNQQHLLTALLSL